MLTRAKLTASGSSGNPRAIVSNFSAEFPRRLFAPGLVEAFLITRGRAIVFGEPVADSYGVVKFVNAASNNRAINRFARAAV